MIGEPENVWEVAQQLRELRDVLFARLGEVNAELARSRQRILALEREKARAQAAMPGCWPELSGR
jgi:hypothetical protein